MAKKNEFVITVGFNRFDPDHVKVANILNGLGRTKAQYIAKAILAYEDMRQPAVPGNGAAGEIIYPEIRRIIEELIDQRIGRQQSSDAAKYDEGSTESSQEIPGMARNDIMKSLAAFRNSSS